MKHRTFRLAIAAGAATLLVLTGCAGGDSNDGGDNGDTGDTTTEGVPFGASMEEYQAAFEDVDPINIRMQTQGTEGSLPAHGRSAYADALEEWSGGKITVEMGWADAFAPNALEWDNAVADGRLDVSMVLPAYEPDVFPSWAELSTGSVLDPFTSTGPLITKGWMTELVFEDGSPYLQEVEDAGLHPLLASIGAYSLTTTFCTEPLTSLADYQGKQVSASGLLKVAEIEAMGGVPVAMPFTDQYEALQRGVLSCVLTSNSSISAGGLEELTPWGLFDSRVAFEANPAGWYAGKAFWDGLPLVAQQLIFDRLDVLIAEEFGGSIERGTTLLDDIKAAGGGPIQFEQEVVDAVNGANEAALAELPAIDQYREASERWTDIVVDELDYGDEPFVDWLESGTASDRDMQPFIDKLFEDVLLKHRPS